MLSGNPLDQWALSRKAVDFGKAVAKEFGVDTTNSQVMVDELKSIPSIDLQKVSNVIFQRVCISNYFSK